MSYFSFAFIASLDWSLQPRQGKKKSKENTVMDISTSNKTVVPSMEN